MEMCIKVSVTDEYFYSSRATILMSLGRKSIVIYASTLNWSSDLNESKVDVQTCLKKKKKRFREILQLNFDSPVQLDLFFFCWAASCLKYKI